MFTSPCGKCNGTGRLNWTQLDAGRCWTCSGTGSFSTVTDPTILAARRESARKKRAAASAGQAAESTRRVATREERYADDPRIGPETRARIAQFPMVGFEAYRLLELVDGGKSLPHVLVNLSR